MNHISYSQYSAYKKCPRSWYLGKVVGAPERPAWYTAVGTAVHQMIEDSLLGEPRAAGAEGYLYPLIRKSMTLEPDTTQWMHSLDDKGEPIVEERAVKHVQDCFERALEILEDWDVWEVEYDASGFLPGCDPEIKAFIDIVGEHKKRGPGFIDWKTGKSKDRFQLDTYAAIERGEFDLDPSDRNWEGYFAMLSPWVPQSQFLTLDIDPATVAAKYQDVWLSMRARFYKTTHTEAVCGFCFQRENCKLRSSDPERAAYYDKAEEDGYPF